jgi:hypothetical protein
MFVKKRRTWSQKLATDYLSVGFFASLFLINRYASLVTRPGVLVPLSPQRNKLFGSLEKYLKNQFPYLLDTYRQSGDEFWSCWWQYLLLAKIHLENRGQLNTGWF